MRFSLSPILRTLFFPLKIALAILLYYAAARFGLLLAFGETNATAVWPPSGLAFALILLWGYRIWPGIFLGAFFANFAAFYTYHLYGFWTIFFASLFIASGNTLEAAVGGMLFKKFKVHVNPLSRTRDIFTLIGVAVAMSLVSAAIGPSYLLFQSMISWLNYSTVLFTWWLGDVTGILALTPLLLAFFSRPLQIKWNTQRLVEGALLFSLLFFSIHLSFGALPMPYGVQYPAVTYLSVPFLVWAVFRFSERVVTSAIIVMAVVAVWNTVRGFGPFVRPEINESLLLLQSFVSIVAGTILVMAAVVAESRKAQEEVRRVMQAESEQFKLFSMIISHDLQTPLAKIIGLIDLLELSSGKSLDGKARDYIARIRSASKNMSKQIDDLVHFSMITVKEASMEPVDVQQIMEEVLSDLELKIREQGAHIEAQGLPVVAGDRIQLRELFLNLCSNALKFAKSKEPLVVNIEWKPIEKDQVEIRISDNGIGFPPENAEKIFSPFERLHTGYGGHGMGLAICQRIVTRHGGSIRAKSAPGKGTTFIMQLPMARLQPVEDYSARAA